LTGDIIGPSDVSIKATDDMFLGGTIVSKPNSEKVVVCGHSWANEVNQNSANHQINPSGSCFVVNLQTTNSKPIGIFPLTDKGQSFLSH